MIAKLIEPGWAIFLGCALIFLTVAAKSAVEAAWGHHWYFTAGFAMPNGFGIGLILGGIAIWKLTRPRSDVDRT